MRLRQHPVPWLALAMGCTEHLPYPIEYRAEGVPIAAGFRAWVEVLNPPRYGDLRDTVPPGRPRCCPTLDLDYDVQPAGIVDVSHFARHGLELSARAPGTAVLTFWDDERLPHRSYVIEVAELDRLETEVPDAPTGVLASGLTYEAHTRGYDAADRLLFVQDLDALDVPMTVSQFQQQSGSEYATWRFIAGPGIGLPGAQLRLADQPLTLTVRPSDAEAPGDGRVLKVGFAVGDQPIPVMPVDMKARSRDDRTCSAGARSADEVLVWPGADPGPCRVEVEARFGRVPATNRLSAGVEVDLGPTGTE